MAKHKTLIEITPQASRLHHVAVLMKEKNIVTVAQLANILDMVPADLYKIFEGHIFRGNNPSYVVNKRASRLAHFLFPKAPFPDDMLAALVRDHKDLTLDDIDHIPVLMDLRKMPASEIPRVKHTPSPDRPTLSYSKGKWTLSKPYKT